MSDVSIVVPYTRHNPEVTQALADYQVAFCDVSDSDEAYWELLAHMWDERQTFVVVEHDVVVRPGALEELIGCPQPWCSFGVPYVGRIYAGLACAKFSAELIARTPDLLALTAAFSDETHPPRHWCRLDSWIQIVLGEAGEKMCVHTPPLGHLREQTVHLKAASIAPSHEVCR